MGNCVNNKSDKILSDATFESTPLEKYNFTKVKVVKVYDGDTYWIVANHNGNIYRYKFRLYGCDCPEIRTKHIEEKERGLEAKKYVSSIIDGKVVNVKILNNEWVDGHLVQEKYGRLLGYMWINEINLTDELIRKGYAKPYFGGKKQQIDVIDE